MANPFVSLVWRQLRGDLQSLPRRVYNFRPAQRALTRSQNIGDLRDAARSRLPRPIFDFVDGGANDERTARRNRSDLQAIQIYPRPLVDVSIIDLTTTALGEPISIPIIGAPTGLTGLVHHEGEAGVARAVQRNGSIYVLSTMSSYSIEEIASMAPGPKWFQLYLWRDRGFVLEMLQAARNKGFSALVVTVDVARTGRRERDLRNGFSVPPRMTARALLGGIRHPGWAVPFAHHSRFLLANTPSGYSAINATSLSEFAARQFDDSVTWDTFRWIRDQWDGPLVIKGIIHPADAVTAVGLGADAVVVSNHGGRQLDDAPSTVASLPAIVDAVGGEAEVYLDGGVRRGSDALKALALGARACLVGRPLVYGLAVAGERGVSHALHLLRQELETAMALAGMRSVQALNPGCLIAPNLDMPRGVRPRRQPALENPPDDRGQPWG